ncbi:TetR family transcriptional regulator [Streptomyces sp. NPDC014685]|uniref:TetR/AcrR family transcriptional regulator n=1 Tax=Streptomyces sp. NPDC014685 TaxID=3364881 RepID=UPI0036FA21BB
MSGTEKEPGTAENPEAPGTAKKTGPAGTAGPAGEPKEPGVAKKPGTAKGPEKPGTAKKRTAAKRSAGRPRRLDPDAMVAITRRIIEEEGVNALSMRRVAKELGSTPMALYHYVRDKDELLMLTLSGTAAAFPRPELPEDPRERLVAVAAHMHGILARLPWVLDVLALGGLTDRNALWMVEEIVDSAIACGLSPARAVRAYGTIWNYVYGDLTFRRAAERRAENPPSRRYFPEMVTEEDTDELPRLVELRDRWREYVADYEVVEELDAIVEGLLARGTAPGRGGSPA